MNSLDAARCGSPASAHRGQFFAVRQAALRHAARLRAGLAGRQQRRIAGDPAKQPRQGCAEFVAATRKRAEPTPMGSSGTGSIPHLAIEQLADSERCQAAPYPLQGCRTGHHGPDGRPDRRVLRRCARVTGASARWTTQGARRGFEQAAPCIARGEDPGRARHQWRRHQQLVCALRARQDAARNHRRAQQGGARLLDQPGGARKLLKTGTEPAPSTTRELAAIQKRDTEKWAKLIRARNIKANDDDHPCPRATRAAGHARRARRGRVPASWPSGGPCVPAVPGAPQQRADRVRLGAHAHGSAQPDGRSSRPSAS